MNEILANAIATSLLAIVAALGGALNHWLHKRKSRNDDLAAANEKIRAIENRLGITATEIKTMDDVFKEIRRINAQLDKEGVKS